MSTRRVGDTRHEIVGSQSGVSGENRRDDYDADRGSANEPRSRMGLSISSFVRLALPHVRSMRRLRQPDAIVRGLRVQGYERLLPSQCLALDLLALRD